MVFEPSYLFIVGLTPLDTLGHWKPNKTCHVSLIHCSTFPFTRLCLRLRSLWHPSVLLQHTSVAATEHCLRRCFVIPNFHYVFMCVYFCIRVWIVLTVTSPCIKSMVSNNTTDITQYIHQTMKYNYTIIASLQIHNQPRCLYGPRGTHGSHALTIDYHENNKHTTITRIWVQLKPITTHGV